MNDGAPNPIMGYKLYLNVQDRNVRFGPSENQLVAAEAQGTLIDATPGSFLPRETTSFSLAAGDPQLSGFNPASQKLVATIKLVYAGDVTSTYFSANSYPVSFQTPAAQVGGLRGRANRNNVVLDWQADSLSGIASFTVLRSSQAAGPFHPISRDDISVGGMQGNFMTVDNLSRRMPDRTSTSLFYMLEVNSLDGSSSYTEPVEVDIEAFRRGHNGR